MIQVLIAMKWCAENEATLVQVNTDSFIATIVGENIEIKLSDAVGI